jgi:TrmH family RNA methyltransferase
MPRISSSDNPRLKEAARLIASSRERRKSGRCVLEGEHLVEVYCRRYGPPETLLAVVSAVDRPTVRALLARVPPARTLVVAESAWAELAQLPAAVGLLAVVAPPVPGIERAADFCLLLDGVQDPGNVGSMLRSAAAAGVAQVFMSPHCAFAWSPKVLRAGQGAHFHLAIFEGIDLGAWARAYRGKVVAMVAAAGETLYQADLSGPVAVAIGNEGAGLSDELVAAARLRVTIPMPGEFESLNAASAAAIALYECVRQRTRRARS